MPSAAVLPLVALGMTAVLRLVLISDGAHWTLRDVILSQVVGWLTVFCLYMGKPLLHWHALHAVVMLIWLVYKKKG